MFLYLYLLFLFLWLQVYTSISKGLYGLMNEEWKYLYCQFSLYGMRKQESWWPKFKVQSSGGYHCGKEGEKGARSSTQGGTDGPAVGLPGKKWTEIAVWKKNAKPKALDLREIVLIVLVGEAKPKTNE